MDNQTYGTSTTGAPRLNLLRIEEDLSAAHLRLARVQIEHLSWDKCVTKYDRPHTLFFLDPPYWQTEGYGVEFGMEHYERMSELMRSIKGKGIITVNDHPAMRKIFAGLTMKTLDITYTVGGQKSAKKTKELLIWNW